MVLAKSIFMVMVGASALAANGCRGTPSLDERAHGIAQNLVDAAIRGENPDHPDLVSPTDFLGENMRPELKQGYTIEVTPGDPLFSEATKAEASHTITVRTTSYERCIRLWYDAEIDRFHILGYYTKRSPD